MWRWLYNSKNSFAFQVNVTLAIIIFLSTGATLAICLAFSYNLADTSYALASSSIRQNTNTNVQNAAEVIAKAIENEIRIVATSICLKEAAYSAALISNGTKIVNSKITTILKPVDSFPEFNFVGGCQYPECPKDYGQLKRLAVSGSMQSTSVYVMFKNGSQAEAIRTTSKYNSVFSKYGDAASLVDTVGPQDLDMKTLFNYGPSSIKMFYLATVYPISYSGSSERSGIPKGASYLAMHRTYPGILKESTTYDSTSRPWFQEAPINDFHVYGPYLETFTKELSLTISSRSSTLQPSASPQGSKYITTVSAVVIMLKFLADIINEMEYPNSGKGILLNYQTLEVVTYGKFDFSTLHGSTGFKNINELDPNLAKFNLRATNNFEYTDPSGVNWIVATLPFLKHTKYSTGVRDYAFIMIVFSRSDQALESIPELRNLIDGSGNTILGTTVGISIAAAGILMTVVYFFVQWLTMPLNTIRSLSAQIVEISAEEESVRSYLKVIEDGQTSIIVRWDEIGSLGLYFWEMVNKLHFDNIKNQKRAKYPKNPFFVSGAPNSNAPVNASLKWSHFDRLFNVSEDTSLGNALNDDSNHIKRSKRPSQTKTTESVHAPSQLKHPASPGQSRSQSRTEKKPEEVNEVMINPTTSDSSLEPSKVVRPRCIPSSLRLYWYSASLLLMAGLTLVILATLYQLNVTGNIWMENTDPSMTNKQILDLKVVSRSKAISTMSFFVEMQMNLMSSARFQSVILDGDLTRSNLSTQSYLPSYSLDSTNFYASKVAPSVKFSGYYVNSSTACKTQQKCAPYQFTQEIKQTSLFDLQYQSYFHNLSKIDSLQTGFEKSAVTRNIPYVYKSYGAQNQCYIEHRSFSFCDNMFKNSKCADPSSTTLTYPPYDPRCRNWYYLSWSNGDPNKMYVENPRVASTNLLSITGGTPLRRGASSAGEIYGVFIVNTNIQALSDEINTIKILKNGYCYLIDTSNPSQLIIHPKLNFFVTGASVMSQVQPVEGFSDHEYADFNKKILSNFSRGSLTASYQKGGKTWYLASSSFNVSTATYTLIATVPLDDISEASRLVQNEISKNIEYILYIFIYTLAAFAVLVIIFELTVVRAIIRPLNDLRRICQKVASGDNDVEVPKDPSSLDMKILLDAFTDMLVAIRYGGDSFSRGHLDIAQKVFQEYLRIYTVLGNKRGIGVSQNNLGALSLSRGDYSTAESYFRHAVANARSMIETVTSWELAGKFHCVLSDRLGNLAVAYMEQGRIEDATNLLYEVMEEDTRQNYIRGYIVKQGTLGLLLLKRKAYDAATRVITDALQFAGSHNSGLLDDQWTSEEAAVTEQIALCNIGLLYETQGRIPEAEEAYIDSLTYHEIMHVSTTTKALMALRNIFVENERHEDVLSIDAIAAAHNFRIQLSMSLSSKRVVFVLEVTYQVKKAYVKDMLLGVRQLQHTCMTGHDLCGIVHSIPGGATNDVPLSKMSGHERLIDYKLNSFLTHGCRTVGSPVDALTHALDTLDDESLSTVDWIIMCTDSDNFDKNEDSFKRLRARLSQVIVGVVVIGLGHTPSDVLRELCGASRNGVYLHASPDTKSIDEAFTSATKFIQGEERSYSKGQLMLEEM